MSDRPANIPFVLALLPTSGDPGRLLLPGTPVFSVRDELFGWVVTATDGTSVVHCPTEGDGHVHSLDESWGLCPWEDGEQVNAGWDRLRRTIHDEAKGALDKRVFDMLRAFHPGLPNVLWACGVVVRGGLARELVLFDKVGAELVRRV